jgi:hypothetical protein
MARRALPVQLTVFVGLMLANAASGQLPEFSPPAPIPESEILQGRNLALYEDGGKFLAALRQPIKTAQMEKLRSFILQHWKQHRRGYVRVTFAGIDSLAESHIFIEPYDAGNWRIIWREIYHQAMIPPPPLRLMELPVIAAVERAKRSKDDWLPGADILIFRDKDGKEVRRL